MIQLRHDLRSNEFIQRQIIEASQAFELSQVQENSMARLDHKIPTEVIKEYLKQKQHKYKNKKQKRKVLHTCQFLKSMIEIILLALFIVRIYMIVINVGTH